MSIMSNVITILLAAKWMPYSPNRWVDPKGDHWLIYPEANSQVVSTAIIKDLHQLQLPRASLHYDGLGIQGGINWEYTLRFVRTLRLKPIHYCIQAALETVMCAACWPAQRIHDINTQFSPICPRCLNGPETSTHTFWECKANEEIEDEAVTSTQSLVPTALLRASELPCLWLRGLLPESLLDTDAIPTPPDLPNIQVIGNPEANWINRIYYGDGSGGQFTSHPCIRRCGVSVVALDDSNQLLIGLHTNLPGKVQTVPRAEYYALQALVCKLVPKSIVEFVTDHQRLFKSFYSAKDVIKKNINYDI